MLAAVTNSPTAQVLGLDHIAILHAGYSLPATSLDFRREASSSCSRGAGAGLQISSSSSSAGRKRTHAPNAPAPSVHCRGQDRKSPAPSASRTSLTVIQGDSARRTQAWEG